MPNDIFPLYNEEGGKKAAENLDNNISPMDDQKMTLTVEELAYHLNVSRTTAYNLARKTSFYPAFKIGHRLIISKQALERWLNEQTGG